MTKTAYLDSHNHKEDNAAATSIIFEIEKGSANKIVWFSNLTAIVDHIQVEIRQNSKIIESLRHQILCFEKDVSNISGCLFDLKDSIEKLNRKLKKHQYKLVDVLDLEDENGNPLVD